MIAEYVAVAGAPSPDTPWPLVLDIAQRGGQFESRRQLTLFEAVTSAIGSAFGSHQGAVEAERERLKREAYPSFGKDPGRAPERFVPNLFAEN